MGNKNAKEEDSVIVANQQFVMKHPKLQKATYKKTNNREYLETHFPVSNNKDYDVWKDALKDSPAQKSEYSLKPMKHGFKKGGMCGNGGTANIQYENYPFTLSEQIKQRSKTIKKNFTEPQLWYLLYGLTDVTSKYHQKGQKAGDIRPENIFLNQNGSFKIATKDSWPGEISAYEKRMFENEKPYLSPEEINDTVVGRQKAEGKIEPSESFSVGLTCLQAALLNNGQNLYHKTNFDQQSLESQKQDLKRDFNYSELYKIVVLAMIEKNPENRATSQEVNDWLKQNQSHIVNMEPFGVNKLTPNVQRVAQTTQFPKKTYAMENEQHSAIGKLKSSIQAPTRNEETYAAQKNPIVYIPPTYNPSTYSHPVSSLPVYQPQAPKATFSHQPVSQTSIYNSPIIQTQVSSVPAYRPSVSNPQGYQVSGESKIAQKGVQKWDEIEDKIRKSKNMFPS